MSYVRYKNEIERIKNSIKLVPFLKHIMRIDNYTVYGSFVRLLVEVCVVGKRVLTTEEVLTWLESHDIDILVTKAESAIQLANYLGTVKESYSYNGFNYINDKTPQSTDWENYKYKIGNHTYYLKGGVKFDVSISNGRAHNIGVDFTCNAFRINYIAIDPAYNRHYDDDVRRYVREKARDEHCKFSIVCNWHRRDMKKCIDCVVNCTIQLENIRNCDVKIWYRMIKLTEYGYFVDYERSEELVDFALNTIGSFYEIIILRFFEHEPQFINIDGKPMHVKNVFLNTRIQSVILKAFSKLSINTIFTKILKLYRLFEILEKKWYTIFVSVVVDVYSSDEPVENKIKFAIRYFGDIFFELSKYDDLINNIYSKTSHRPDLLESVKCLCFIFRYFYNLLMWRVKNITFTEFMENIVKTGISEKIKGNYHERKILDFIIYDTVEKRIIYDVFNFDKLRSISDLLNEAALQENPRNQEIEDFFVKISTSTLYPIS
jgi:hypothetical protein